MSQSVKSNPRLEPPPNSRLGTDCGLRCEPPARSFRATPKQHEGCPGWWPEPNGHPTAGWRCTCSCHEEEFGWPGYDDFINRTGY